MGGDRRLHEPQPTLVYPQLGFPHRTGRYHPGGKPRSLPNNWSRRYKECVLFRGWNRTLPVCRWLHEPQPISNKPVALGFPHRAGRYRPGGPPFSSSVCWSGRCMKGFPIRGWNHIYPAHLALGAGSMNTRLGFPHRAGRY